MSRGARLESLSGYYHVMQRGAGKQILFNTDEDKRCYILTLGYYKSKYNVDIIAYCIMDNHVHLVVRTNTIKDLSGMMACIGNCYAQYYNAKYSHVGHVFQNRFKSRIIESASYLARCVAYVHYNPEEACLCRQSEYKWSSFRDYLSQPHSPKLTDTDIFLNFIGGKEVFLEQSSNYAANAKTEPLLFMNEFSSRTTIDDARILIRDGLGYENGLVIKTLERDARNGAIEFLLKEGVSLRNIERLTGVSRGVSQEISKRLHSE